MRKTDTTGRLAELLKDLRLPAIRTCYREAAQRAARESLGYEQFLLELVEREADVHRQHRIERLLRQSGLPLGKTVQSFDIKRLPGSMAAQVRTLACGGFLDRRENVLAFGNPGSGKTHLLCGIGHELVQAARSVFFAPTALLVEQLLAARRDLRLYRLIKKLARWPNRATGSVASAAGRSWLLLIAGRRFARGGY